MFLRATLELNRPLVEAAAALHAEGAVGVDTFVIDLDAVVENARLVSAEAESLGIRLHHMTKQHGRNALVALAAAEGGIADIVAVDVDEARVMHAHGRPLGHVGHLVQIPAADTSSVVAMRPKVVTVFSVAAARRVSDAAAGLGLEQTLLLRLFEPGNPHHAAQEGGLRVDQIVAAAAAVADLPNVRFGGVTAFPCFEYDYAGGRPVPTANLASLLDAVERLRAAGIEVEQVNAPPVTCVATLPMLAAAGATHGEPGSCLTGNTPLHARGDQPERPAMVYVSEISAVGDGAAYCFGGGFYPRSRIQHALLPAHGDRFVDVDPLPAEAIDYHGRLKLPAAFAPRVGETVVFAFRSQVFVSRSRVAVVGGLSRGRPTVLGVFDPRGNLLGGDGLPVGAREAVERVDQIWSAYRAEVLDTREVG